MAHIFISYSRKDMGTADELKQKLENPPFHGWIDRDEIKAGDDWWGKIVEAIKDCSAFVIILSSNSAESYMVLRELSVALEFKKRIVPLLLDGDPWPQIKHVHCAKSIEDLISGLSGTRLFISHVAEDEEFAAKLADSLTALEANVWRSKDNPSIEALLDTSRIMLLVLSPESMASPATREQWQAFDSKGKQIIPLLLRYTSVPPKLRETQPYIDFLDPDDNIAFAQLYGLLETAGIQLREHERFPIPPQPHLPLSRYDMSKEAQAAIWVSGITLDAFVESLVQDSSVVHNPKLDIRLLMVALDVEVDNETGAWTGINTLIREEKDEEDRESGGLPLLQKEFEKRTSQQKEELTEEGHWVAWRLFKNQKKLKQIREKAPNIQIKTVPHRLAMGYCIIDPYQKESEGILTAAPYFYQIDVHKATQPKEPNVAPIFLSNHSPKQSDRWWFAQYVQEFEDLWKDATPLNLDLLSTV